MNFNSENSKKTLLGSLKEIDHSHELLSFFKTDEKFYQALFELRKPTLLLKYSKNGAVHFRNFYISQNYDKICWVSPKKLRAEVNLKDIVKLIKGRQTDKFKKHKKEEEYENISFSVIYLLNANSSNKNKFETDSIDLTCKDSKEFDIWFYGLKACIYAMKINYELSSLELFLPTEENVINNDSINMNFKSASDLKKENSEQKTIYFWGLNNYLQCGDNSKEEQVLEPKEISQLNKNEDPISLALGYCHSLILLGNGDVYSFGCALNGRLGLEDYDAQTSSENSFLPTKLSIFSMKIKAISCGDFHSAAIDEFGAFYAWGSNYEGQLGVNYYQDRFTPEKVLSSYENELKSSKIIQVRCGSRFTGIITKENNLYMTGKNKFCVLGLDPNKQLYTQFEKVKGINNIGGIACGGYHMLAFDKERKNIFSWGWNQMGQLGNGLCENKEIIEEDGFIKKVFSLDNESNSEILQIEAGIAHSALLVREQKTNSLYTWGSNNNGQLGNGTTENCLSPKLVENLAEEDIAQISCGMFHMGAITKNGQLLMWGDGNNGVLGNGTTSGSKIPLESKNNELAMNRILLVVCGGSHTGIIMQKSLEAKKLATECKSCKVRLDTIFKRKIHCRNCGDLFCTNCSSKKIPIIKLGYIEPVKVCDLCYENLNKFK